MAAALSPPAQAIAASVENGGEGREARKNLRLHFTPARRNLWRRGPRRLTERLEELTDALFFGLSFAAATNRPVRRRGGFPCFCFSDLPFCASQRNNATATMIRRRPDDRRWKQPW